MWITILNRSLMSPVSIKIDEVIWVVMCKTTVVLARVAYCFTFYTWTLALKEVTLHFKNINKKEHVFIKPFLRFLFGCVN